jgi:hypothetical protein
MRVRPVAQALMLIAGVALGTAPGYATHGCDGTWGVVPSPNLGSAESQLIDVAARGAEDVWAVGSARPSPTGAREALIARWDGAGWRVWRPTSGWLFAIDDLPGSAELWAVGNEAGGEPVALRWDGLAWTRVPVASPRGATAIELRDVEAVAADDIWIVGYYARGNTGIRTLIEHWDGTRWAVVASPTPRKAHGTLFAVAASSSTAAWAVGMTQDASGSRPLIEGWNGASWSTVAGPDAGVGTALYDVSVLPSGEAWAVGGGNGPLIERFDGSRWSLVPGPPGGWLAGVDAIDATEAWAVGGAGGQPAVARWDGTSWSAVSTPPLTEPGWFEAVASIAPGVTWAVGQTGDGTLTEHRC